MQILFVIAVLSFLALVWAAIAITRHIRRNAASAQPPAPLPGSSSMASAATASNRSDRTSANKDAGILHDPQTPRRSQSVHPQTTKTAGRRA